MIHLRALGSCIFIVANTLLNNLRNTLWNNILILVNVVLLAIVLVVVVKRLLNRAICEVHVGERWWVLAACHG